MPQQEQGVTLLSQKKLTTFQKAKKYVIQHKKKFVGGATVGVAAFLAWKYLLQNNESANGLVVGSGGSVNKPPEGPKPEVVNNLQSEEEQKQAAAQKEQKDKETVRQIEEKRQKQRDSLVLKNPSPKKGGVVVEGFLQRQVYYDDEKKILRGDIQGYFKCALHPELEKYDIKACSVPKQPDNSSCGQRALVVAAQLVKALREKKDIDQQLLLDNEDKQSFEELLARVFTILPSNEWQTSERFKQAIKKLPELKKELEAKDIADFNILGDSKGRYEEADFILALYAESGGGSNITPEQINRFREGIPQIYIIHVPGMHWITIKIELKDIGGTKRPQVSTFDGKNWKHENQPMINTILFILTEGTEYQVGNFEIATVEEPLDLYKVSYDHITRILLNNQSIPDLLKEEYPEGYRAACASLGRNPQDPLLDHVALNNNITFYIVNSLIFKKPIPAFIKKDHREIYKSVLADFVNDIGNLHCTPEMVTTYISMLYEDNEEIPEHVKKEHEEAYKKAYKSLGIEE